MDETDKGTVTNPEVLAADAARKAAEQLRAQARSQFKTPTWIGPERPHSAHDVTIPAQPVPGHDDLDDLPAAVPESDPIPGIAHWTERARPRLVAGTLLVAALGGVLGFLAVAIITQSIGAIAGLVGCAIVAVIFRGALMSEDLTRVDLKGSILQVRRGGVLDVVNLADPMHHVALIDTPGRPNWRLSFQAVDGRRVELGPAQVDATEMDRIVRHYRSIADRDKRERERRFNR